MDWSNIALKDLIQQAAKLRTTVALAAITLGCGCSARSSHHGDQATCVPPEQVVAKFLEAVRTGDDKEAAGLLTPLARRKASELEMVVAPPGSETARFEIGEVELQKGNARVASSWTDLDADGRLHTDSIVWIMRQESIGWRIAGMSTQLFDDQEPIELNFEDPAEMIRKQQLAEDELARRERQQRQRLQDDAENADSLTR